MKMGRPASLCPWKNPVGNRHYQIPPDLVIKSQAIDIAEVILSRIRRLHVVHTLCRPRKSRCELLSTSEAHWFTTKSFMQAGLHRPRMKTARNGIFVGIRWNLQATALVQSDGNVFAF